MPLRKLVLIGSLAALLGGCVVAPHPHAHRGYHDDHYYYSDDDYYDYHATPSYEGYYYVRVVFIGNIPYYVDDDRHVRPIPHHLHDHFRRSPYRSRDRHAPYFSRDREVRDGYQMSRIVYFNNIPHYVEDGRIARPLPNHMHDRFRASPFARDNERNSRERHAPGRDDDRRNDHSSYDRERERREPPARDRDRDDDRRGHSDPRPYDEPRLRDSPFRQDGTVTGGNGRNTQPQPPLREERGEERGRDNGPAASDRRRDARRQDDTARRQEKRPTNKRSRKDEEDEKENGNGRERTSPFR